MFPLSPRSRGATAGQEMFDVRTKKDGPAVRLYHRHERKPADRFMLATGDLKRSGMFDAG
jgi:hypothetical protein